MVRKPDKTLSDDTADTEDMLPSTNGSQITLHPFLCALDGSVQLLQSEEAFYLSLGVALASSSKTAVLTVKHSLLLRAGFIAKEKYGILKPLPTDGCDVLYSSAIASLASGTAMPASSSIAALPAAPAATDSGDNDHVIAPDRIAIIDLKASSKARCSR